jgi:hypothetical protein
MYSMQLGVLKDVFERVVSSFKVVIKVESCSTGVLPQALLLP